MPETDLGRTDYEPYFERWNSVLHFPNPALPKSQHQKIHGYSGDLGSIPCYQHKSCGGLVIVGSTGSKYPPVFCPECGKNTKTEAEVAHGIRQT